MNERFDDDGGFGIEYASNAGKILTSTLWNQSGTVYVSVGGTQTALTGYTYNQFCPNGSDGKQTITGCSNTADAQILYYWIEKGYDLQLAVKSDNYFKITNDTTTYYVSDTAHSGEGTLSELNRILGSKSRVGNGEFIAALNFFCGVNNHSSFGSDATSTSWYYSVSATGKCAAPFVAAGFDSYYFIARKASGSVPGLFFTGEDGLTELCLSVMRENLDYGEPVRVGIPGHAVYMDGYRVNSDGAYEYHLNYGWGTRSTGTKWYTVSELEKESITYLTIDLSPEVSVRVTSARSDYWGGSFVRGLERINHIVNDRSTTFAFDSSLAGKTITLSAAAKITSKVDVAFENVCVSLATAASELFESARGMSFDISGGSLIVNSSATPCAIRETGNRAVNVTVENGFIYSGNAAGGISAVQSEFASGGGYSFGDFDAAFLASVSGDAVSAGSAADTITLERDAALFGKLSLGSGANILNIGAGSLFYGSFAAAAANTLTVNLTVDAAANAGATAAFADAASGQAFHLATGGVLNLGFSEFGTAARSFDLLCGVSADVSALFAVNITVGDETFTLDASNPQSGYFSLAAAGEKLVLNYAPTPPEVISITPDITVPTNRDVTLTAVFSEDTTYAEYSTDGKIWRSYAAPGAVVKSNGTIWFRAKNISGLVSAVREFTVDWIDKTPPDAPKCSADTTSLTREAVTVTAVFGSDSVVRQYSTDGETWSDYTGGVVMEDNGTAYFRGIDAVGNISAVTAYEVANIDRTPPEKPTASADTASLTRETVTVTAVFGSDSAVRQYSTDGETWSDYTGGVVMEDNGTAYFRGIDEAGNISAVTAYVVANIDRTAPVITITGDNTSPIHRTVLTATTDDGSALYCRVAGAEWNLYTGPIAVAANAVYEFAATDAAGNTGTASIEFANLLPELPEKLDGNATGQSWSSTGAARYIVEYSTDSFRHVISVTVDSPGVDSAGLAVGSYSWRVRPADDDRWVRGANIVLIRADTAPRVVSSDADGYCDVFFGAADGIWSSCYSARHFGSVGDWQGTGETVALAGKGRIKNLYLGSTDANVLLLTDAADGDALFVDDVFTELPDGVSDDRARLAEIKEIRAGAGDDVIDMTSQRFEYAGDGLTVRGGLGSDTIWANKGDNRLFGDGGNDRLVGASGNDLLVGGIGNDSMHGGGGNDVFTFGENWGKDTVEQLAEGSVTLWFASGSGENWNASTLTYADGANSVTVAGVAADRVTLKFGDDGSESYAALADAGAFAGCTSEKIFEDHDRFALASL